MSKYGEGLAKEIVKAVNNGEIQEPLTQEKVKELCKAKNYKCTQNMLNVILPNSEIDAKHSPTFIKYFKRINRGEYVILPEYRELSFEEQIEESKNDTRENRIERLNNIKNVKPELYILTTTKFKRNPDVVVEVLLRANGKCEKCENKAPFIRKSDKSPYLEVHHLVSLSQGGDDTVENCIAVCPNCHRQLHYGE